jgi:hydrogenase-4 component B
MDALRLLVLSVALFGGGALLSLALDGFSRAARITSGLMGTLASIVALAAAVQAARGYLSPLELPVPLPFGNLSLQMDSLSTLMVGMIALVGMAASFYSISYFGHYSDRNLGVLGFCANLFMALMLLVVTIANAFYFLVFWEMMTLASYLLVTFEREEKQAVRAGYLYMLFAHAGGALIMLSFFILFLASGSFEFSVFRQADLSPILRSLVFLMAFIGFGAKAGMVPLHVWMPPAYAAAPSSASALMASVMKKTAIYGILRVCVDFLGASVLWWGLLVLLFGALSAVLGVLFALAEHDIKRILAYSSVENVGIILLGLGTGMVGIATQQPTVTILGFLAALYHLLNHSFFKGLLFLGAGAVDYRLGTSDLNEMGGLGRVMPWTGLCFLVGALALSAIPPINGFVSEWFTYQAFLVGGGSQDLAVRISLPLCAALLALVGTLAAMLAIKAYGSAFSGPARSQKAKEASEVPGSMLLGMAFLALGCVFLGLAAPVLAPYLVSVVAGTFNVPAMTVAGGTWVFPVNMAQGALSTPLTAVLLLGLLVVPLALVAIYGGGRAGSRVVDDPWACGYRYSSSMSVTASSFDQPVGATFGRIYGLRVAVQRPMKTIGTWSKRARETISNAEPVLENILKRPTTRAVDFLGQRIQILQMGDIRMYCLYIVVTLAILLLVIFR